MANDSVLNYGMGPNPTGTIIHFFGESAPEGYLACDGTTYNKVDYPALSTHLLALTNHSAYEVSGDTTKFKVPDLRGEFLRGTGTNSRTNMGSGAAVGTHQDGTAHRYFGLDTGNNIYWEHISNNTYREAINKDTNIKFADANSGRWIGAQTGSGGNYTHYTARPTNTSVLYCIKT